MKKVSYAMGLALAMSLAAFATSGAQAKQKHHQDNQQQAEGRRGPGGRGGEGFLLKGITLNQNQKQQVKTLRQAQRTEFDAKRGERETNGGQKGQVARTQRDTAGRAARRAEMATRREQHVASLRNILTSNQRVQFDKNVAEMKQRMADGRRGGEKRGA